MGVVVGYSQWSLWYLFTLCYAILRQKQFIRYNDNSNLQHLYCFNYIWCSIRYMLNCKCIIYSIGQIGKFAKCAGDIEFWQPFLRGQLSDIGRAILFFCGLSVQFYYNFYYHVLLKCAGKWACLESARLRLKMSENALQTFQSGPSGDFRPPNIT